MEDPLRREHGADDGLHHPIALELLLGGLHAITLHAFPSVAARLGSYGTRRLGLARALLPNERRAEAFVR